MKNIFSGIFDDGENTDTMDNSQDTKNSENNGTLRLHKEELDITKNKVQTGEVILRKEIVEEQKTVDVPVTHEEVVIERTPISNQSSSYDSSISDEETIRIPVTEEQVQVDKHTVATDEVSAYKRQIEETHQVDETLKREEARIDRTGDAVISKDDTNQSFQ